MNPSQLEIGPGEARLGDDWVTLDVKPRAGVVDFVCQWGSEPLPFPDNSFNLVYAGHVLEHIPWYQTVAALTEVWRVMCHAGIFEVHVPDLTALLKCVAERRCLDDFAEAGYNAELHWMHWFAERLFHMEPEAQWHRACFNEEHLRWCLTRAGFMAVHRIRYERGLINHGVINLGLCARKY